MHITEIGMQVRFGCELSYEIDRDTPFLFNIEAQHTPTQLVEDEQLLASPAAPLERWNMPESGNPYFRVMAPAGQLTVSYKAIAQLKPQLEPPERVSEVGPNALPLSVFTHLYPSRYCQSDRLERFARSTFGTLPSGYARVNEICNWICEYVSYEGGVSDGMTSAFDTVTQRAGVCRDFAHLAIAICRALGIPARYVSGYALRLDPPDFHAVFEAYLQGPISGGWYMFDPTRKADPAGIVRIGVGRDAAEVAFCSPFGPIKFGKPKVWIEAVDGADRLATVQAVRAGAPEA